MDENKTLGEIIRKARIDKNMSQSDLAEKAGVSRQTIGFMERDRFSAPGPDKISRIAEVLDLNKEELFILVGYATPTVTTQKDIILRRCVKDLDEIVVLLRSITNKMRQL